MLELVDTHCHLQFPQYKLGIEDVIKRASGSGVGRLITVGTNGPDSQSAIKLAESYENVWATVGLHPHDADNWQTDKPILQGLISHPKVVAVGECGLDYYRQHSSKQNQALALRWQIELALEHNLPIIFHIRDAYADFWPIVDEYKGLKAVAHCFSAGQPELDEILKRGWYVGLNGIVTFSKNSAQMAVFKAVPLAKLLLETDAPYLTPTPLRGKVNEPKNVLEIAKFLSNLRGETLDELATASTANAHQLFGI
jgi:TatD DNase family protein